MPISFNDTVVVGPPKVASHNGVQSVMYPTSIQSCDHTQTWRLVIVEALQATTVIVPDYTLARVRGLVVPALHTGEQHGYIDVNFGSLERFYGKVNGPTDALVNITGTICSRYFGGRKCLILEGDKAHPEGWYLGICISRAFEEFWATASVGSVIQAAGRFSGFARLALGTGDGDLTLFEPLHVQDISPGVVSIPHGWQNKAGGLRGWSQAIRSNMRRFLLGPGEASASGSRRRIHSPSSSSASDTTNQSSSSEPIPRPAHKKRRVEN